MVQPKCNLIIDSCCDLPAHVVAREGVYLVKFPYIMGGGQFEDDLYQVSTPHDFFEGMRKGAQPSTAQLSVSSLADAFAWAINEGLPTVFLSFSSGLSGSYDVSMMVREQVLADYPDFELHIVDTQLASLAEALLVYEAIEQREKGLSAEELAAWAEEAKYFVNAQFMVDDLGALERGGRIPSSIAYAGSKLDVKPLLGFTLDGKLALSGVARGRKKGIKNLVSHYEGHVGQSRPGSLVIVGGSDCPKDIERLKDQIRKVDESVVFLECSVGPVIGSHVGPDMVAVVFWGEDRRNDVSIADRIARKVRGE